MNKTITDSKSADLGVDYLYDTWTGFVVLGANDTQIPINAKFIPDTIKVQISAVGILNGANDIVFNPLRTTVNGAAGAIQAANMQLVNLTSRDLIEGAPNITQCNLMNTFNPIRVYSNMGRRNYQQTYTVRAQIVGENNNVANGGVMLSIEFSRKRTKEDR